MSEEINNIEEEIKKAEEKLRRAEERLVMLLSLQTNVEHKPNDIVLNDMEKPKPKLDDFI